MTSGTVFLFLLTLKHNSKEEKEMEVTISPEIVKVNKIGIVRFTILWGKSELAFKSAK